MPSGQRSITYNIINRATEQTKVLPKLKITHVIGKAVWDQRDAISIGKLVRKNDGPEEIEQILSTMIKYGGIKEH